jgi:D-sedoheptulose 7-phosphate isomerase
MTALQPARLATPTGLDHVDRLRQALAGGTEWVDTAARWGREFSDVLGSGGRLLAAGNGGSAAQAQHLTAELVGRYRDERRPLSAICLSSETSTLTAVVNDYGGAELFARQVRAHGRAGDVCVLFSTSGGSANVLAAAAAARECGVRAYAMTGPAPNPLAAACDDVLAIDAPFTATVQELHLVSLHILCAELDAALLGGAR